MLGILAGMGPKSTAPFVRQVIHECQVQYGACEDLDFPHMLIYSLPTPVSLSRPLEVEPFCTTVEGGLKKLQENDVELIAMPCNTAHLFYDRLAAGLKVPLINMVDCAVKATPESAQKVALLATRFTTDARIYQDALDERGLGIVAGESWQSRVDGLLNSIRSSSRLDEAAGLWRALANDLYDSGADTALIACTDLNPVLDAEPGPMQVIDATQLLAAELIRRWKTSEGDV